MEDNARPSKEEKNSAKYELKSLRIFSAIFTMFMCISFLLGIVLGILITTELLVGSDACPSWVIKCWGIQIGN